MKLVVTILFLLKCSVFAINFNSRARNFSLEILYHTQQEEDGHVIISPFGIWSLMTSVAVGAQGRSQSQLMRALRLPKSEISIVNGFQGLSKTLLNTEDDDGDAILKSYNFMFIDREFTINQDFQRKIQSDFNTNVINLQFDSPTATEMVNNIIKNTGSTVSDVFNSDDFSQSNFILTNVINFKGVWKSPFNESDTRIEPFYDENKNVVGEANIMYKIDVVPLSGMKSLQSRVLELPFGDDNKFCMLLILPNPRVNVIEAYKNLQNITIEDIFDKLQRDVDDFGLEEVEIKLPRFKISTNIVLNKPFMDMGVFDIFDEDLADFKPITDNSVYVSAIIHNANIEVTESGTTASAVTAAEFRDRMSMLTFEATRPFIYFVMEKPTATIIFGGIYSQPTVF